MGFFNDIKNIVKEVITDNVVQTDNDVKNVVDGLLEKEQIQNNPVIKRILNKYENYEKLDFGIEACIEPELVYGKFDIPSDEIIIVVYKAKAQGITLRYINKIIMTDKAVYLSSQADTEDKLDEYFGINIVRIPLEELCGYLVEQEGDDSKKFYLINKDTRYYLFKEGFLKSITSDIIEKTTVAANWVELFEDIQRASYIEWDISKEKYDKLCEWVMAVAKEELEEGKITDTTERRMFDFKHFYSFGVLDFEMLLRFGGVNYDMTHKLELIFLENRIHDDFDGLRISDYEPVYMEDKEQETRDCIKNMYESFYNALKNKDNYCSARYWDSLSGISIKSEPQEIEVEDLSSKSDIDEKKKNWLKSVMDIGKEYTEKIKPYIVVRKCCNSSLSLIQSYLGRLSLDSDEKELLLKQAVYYKNRNMLDIYNTIKNDEKLSKDVIGLTDTLGLTPLHYAIHLKNKKNIKFLMKNCDQLCALPAAEDEYVFSCYDYCIWAMAYENYELVNELLEKRDEFKPLISRRKRLKGKITVFNGLNSLAAGNERKMNEVMNEAERRNAYIPSEAYEKQQQAQSNKESTEEKLFELKEELQEVENEIKDLKLLLFNECQKMYDRMCNSSGIENYISEIISSDLKIKEYLVTNLDMAEIFWFGNRAVYIPHNVAEETRKQQAEEERRREEEKRAAEEEKRAEDENRRQSDEDEENSSEGVEIKWFSSEACRNKDILSKEYHKLVLKYHPDSNPAPEALKKFLSIQEEREKILENLEK